MLIGSQAFADHMQGDHMTTKEQSMKMRDCMSRMSAKNDGSTHHQMKAACKTEMHKEMNGTGMNKDSSNDDNMGKSGDPQHDTAPKN